MSRITWLAGTGWFAVPRSIFEDPRLNVYECKILVYLCRKAGPDGVSFPGIDTICLETMIPRRTVVRCLSQLEEYGWVMKRRRESTGKVGRPHNEYALQISTTFSASVAQNTPDLVPTLTGFSATTSTGLVPQESPKPASNLKSSSEVVKNEVVKNEVETTKNAARISSRKDQSALQMAKDSVAWGILSAAETKFGWRLPKSRRREEHGYALELLGLWPEETILRAIAAREKPVTSLKWLSDFIPKVAEPGGERPPMTPLPPEIEAMYTGLPNNAGYR